MRERFGLGKAFLGQNQFEKTGQGGSAEPIVLKDFYSSRDQRLECLRVDNEKSDAVHLAEEHFDPRSLEAEQMAPPESLFFRILAKKLDRIKTSGAGLHEIYDMVDCYQFNSMDIDDLFFDQANHTWILYHVRWVVEAISRIDETTLSRFPKHSRDQLSKIKKDALGVIERHQDTIAKEIRFQESSGIGAWGAIATLLFGNEEQRKTANMLLKEHLIEIERIAGSRHSAGFGCEDFLVVMLRFGDDELKRAAMEVCKNAILFNEYIIAGLLNSRDLAVRQFGIQIIEDNLQEYGLSFQELWPKWEMSANNSYESRRVGQNLKVLYEVERMRAGSAKLLIDRYGINCFGRYTPEILVAQCEIHEREIPYGVVIVSRHDHSGTFYGGAMSSFLNQIKQQLGDTIGIRIIECGDKGEIARSLYALDAEYGDKNKISFCIVIAHGNGRGDGLVLGPNADKPGQSIKKKDFENRRARLLKDCFVAGFETVFFSCETGVEDGLAQGASRGWDMSTTGPQEPFATADVTVSLDDNNLPHFTMAFDGGKPAHRYSKGSPEKHT